MNDTQLTFAQRQKGSLISKVSKNTRVAVHATGEKIIEKKVYKKVYTSNSHLKCRIQNT